MTQCVYELNSACKFIMRENLLNIFPLLSLTFGYILWSRVEKYDFYFERGENSRKFRQIHKYHPLTVARWGYFWRRRLLSAIKISFFRTTSLNQYARSSPQSTSFVSDLIPAIVLIIAACVNERQQCEEFRSWSLEDSKAHFCCVWEIIAMLFTYQWSIVSGLRVRSEIRWCLFILMITSSQYFVCWR